MQIEPRKKARQARAMATEAAIVEAAARILEDLGPESLTTNRIADRAGVSIGSLYQYFPNKGAILVALIRRERVALLAEVRDIAAYGCGAADKIDALIDAGLAHQFRRPRLALMLEYLERTLALDEEALALSDALADAILTIVRDHAPQADDRAARDVVAMCRAMIDADAMAGEPDANALRARLRRAVHGYLA